MNQTKKPLRFFAAIAAMLMMLGILSGCEKHEKQDPAEEQQTEQKQTAILENYNVNIQIDGKNRLVITETLTVNYPKQIGSICRVIPYEGYRLNPSVNEIMQYRMQLDRIDADTDCSVHRETGKAYITLGKPDPESEGGTQIYSLKYRLSNYKDKDNLQDIMLCDFIPYEWEGKMHAASISLTMPKDFEETGIRLYRYSGGSWLKSTVPYTVSGQTISLMLKEEDILANPQLNIMIQLPEGYFRGEKSLLPAQIFIYVMLILVTAGMLVLWWIFGKPAAVPKTEKHAFINAGLTPLEEAYLVRRTVTITDLAAFLTYWAENGIIRITQIKAREYTLSCLHTPGKASKNFEFTLYEALFGKGEKTLTVREASSAMRRCLPKVRRQVARSCAALCGGRMYTLESFAVKYGALLLTAVPVMVIMAVGGHMALDYSAAYLGLVIGIVLLLVHGGLLWLKRVGHTFTKTVRLIFTAIYLVIEAVVVGGVIYYGMSVLHMGWQIILLIVLTLLLLGIVMLSGRMTEGYLTQLGIIREYKKYLCRTQTDMQDISSYYYRNLPQAYVLRIGKTFSKRCDGYLLQKHDRMLALADSEKLSHTAGFYSVYQQFIGTVYRSEFKTEVVRDRESTSAAESSDTESSKRSGRKTGFFMTVGVFLAAVFQQTAHWINNGIDWCQARFKRREEASEKEDGSEEDDES